MSADRLADLREALAALMSLMHDRAAFGRDAGGQSRRLDEQILAIDRLKSELPPDAPEMLRHFLEKRSYPKALELLMDRMTPDEKARWRPAC